MTTKMKQDLRTAVRLRRTAFGQLLRYFAAVLFGVPAVRLPKSSQNASYLAKCVSPN